LQANQTHYGIFFCPNRQQATIGQIVKICVEYHELISAGVGTADELQNQWIVVD